MQIELLDTFLDLVETRSFHRTAERLSVTQSTVSARVQTLEAAVGARLFTRSRAGTDLTTEGLRFETHARMLRRDWNEAKRAVAPTGESAVIMRLGIQNDLADAFIGDLLADFRRMFPQMAFYIEPDYSAQMCADIVAGVHDFAVLFTPKPHPDLHFVTLADLPYRLISSDAATRAEIKLETYISGHFSAAFEQAHRTALPELIGAPLSVGQSSTIASLLLATGGSGFVMAEKAAEMVATGRFKYVADVEAIDQPVFAAMHLRQRVSKAHRKLTRMLAKRFVRSSDPARG
ncbi:LysR family transcriptional regulator [Cypionkella psychrotolerans]|uniref:LysR family transcriptional regulator n=1 Tax=Cypionkella psychrotolerans TaxID=1678131 RepID=UPI0006B61C06|nr:LysR family transcriptional regulator [Cypionkella psychrotolerans]